MSIHFDDKGKFFTNVVQKEALRTVIQTLTHRVQGNIHVRQGRRLKDELDETEQFIAVTEAEIYDAKGQKIFSTAFLVVNRDQVVWLIPYEDLDRDLPEGGSE
jgi:hypothetical protein